MYKVLLEQRCHCSWIHRSANPASKLQSRWHLVHTTTMAITILQASTRTQLFEDCSHICQHIEREPTATFKDDSNWTHSSKSRIPLRLNGFQKFLELRTFVFVPSPSTSSSASLSLLLFISQTYSKTITDHGFSILLFCIIVL